MYLPFCCCFDHFHFFNYLLWNLEWNILRQQECYSPIEVWLNSWSFWWYCLLNRLSKEQEAVLPMWFFALLPIKKIVASSAVPKWKAYPFLLQNLSFINKLPTTLTTKPYCLTRDKETCYLLGKVSSSKNLTWNELFTGLEERLAKSNNVHVYESLKRHTALQKVVIYNFHLNTATSVCMRKVLGQWWARWDLLPSYLKPKRWARHSTVTHWYICIYKLWWVLWRKRVKCFFLFCFVVVFLFFGCYSLQFLASQFPDQVMYLL